MNQPVTGSTITQTGAVFLIIGTSVGAGILGLPVETGLGGFFPSLIFLLLTWLIMTFSALCLAKVLNRSTPTSNFVSLSNTYLGPLFKYITLITYLILFISLTLAYLKGGGIFLHEQLPYHLPLPLYCLLFLLTLSPLIIFGQRILTTGNLIFTCGIFVSFIILIILGIPLIKPRLLSHMNWTLATYSYPFFLPAFGFHSILPSLHTSLNNIKKLKRAIIWGTSITCIIYLLWQFMILGIIPIQGTHGLATTLANDQTAITPLGYFLSNHLLLKLCGNIFYFTAITTSFLGVGWGLLDFLLDTFQMPCTWKWRIFFAMLVYLPALAIAQSNIRIFYISLKYGGGITCLYLLVILPITCYYKLSKA